MATLADVLKGIMAEGEYILYDNAGNGWAPEEVLDVLTYEPDAANRQAVLMVERDGTEHIYESDASGYMQSEATYTVRKYEGE